MAVCTPKQAAFFSRMVPLFRPIAKRLDFDEDFLLALCAFEDSWGADAHNDKLHNLFGITQAGGNNLKFASDQACCDYWENHYGNTMTGSADFAEFARRLRMLGYNSVNPAYDRNLSDTYRSVVAHKAACDVR